uniref:Uncharacterized protein n=1 Tax=Lotus japonicus TaxID=34305 RepID=I3SZ82_LOTJA|nr:unknown [Lotus japonicus]
MEMYLRSISAISTNSMSHITTSVALFQMCMVISLQTVSLGILNSAEIHCQKSVLIFLWLLVKQKHQKNQKDQRVLLKSRFLCMQAMLHWVLSLSFLLF